MSHHSSVGVRRLGAVVVAASLLSACGSGTPHASSSTDASRQSGATGAVEAVVRSLFSAFKSQDHSAACRDYTLSTQAAVVAAAKKISSEERQPLEAGLTCAAGLRYISNLTPQTTQATSSLGAPTFIQVDVNGDTAVVTYTASEVNGLLARSTVTLDRVTGRWLVDKATSLTFTHH